MKIFRRGLGVLLLSFLIINPVLAGKDVRTYELPDVKNDFCGVHIDFQWCKCAFHNQYCKAVGSEPGLANHYVLQQFIDWNQTKIQNMGEQCLQNDGYWDKNDWQCTHCTEGDVLSDRKCVTPEKIDPEVAECKAAMRDFDTNWDKYSDFDDRLGYDVSYEVGQFNQTLDEIADLIAEAQELEYQMALEIEVRKELKAYKQALVLNIQQNITKAIFRLSWVTFDAIKGGYGAKGSIKTLVGTDPTTVVQKTGAVLKLVQGQIPKSAKEVSFDTSTVSGKIKSAAWNATLETMESAGDPVAIATQVTKDARGAAVSGPDISDEEVAILHDQHLSKDAANTAIADSYAASAKMRAELAAKQSLITEKYNELQDWKLQEFKRVKGELEDQCKDKLE